MRKAPCGRAWLNRLVHYDGRCTTRPASVSSGSAPGESVISSTFSSRPRAEISDARRVVIRLAVYLLPFVVFPGVPLALAAAAGELTSIGTVAARQLREPVLYGRAYREDYFAFKLIQSDLVFFGTF